MKYLGPDLIGRMQAELKDKCGEPKALVLGIGNNTWAKILDGEPVRASVADRLLERFGARAASDRAV